MTLLSTVSELLKPAAPPNPQILAALARVNELVDPMIKAAGGYEHKLVAPLQHALGYCDGLVSAFPGPVDITHRAFSSDPLVHALFATASDIDQMLGRSLAVRDYLASAANLENDHFYALFAARRQQKKQLGLSMRGNVIESNVPQLVMYFCDHTLTEPSLALASTLQKLRQQALDSLLATFRTHVNRLRLERDGLRAHLSVERSLLASLGGSSHSLAYDEHSRHVTELAEQLSASLSSLMPEHLLQALGDFLLTPEPSLALTPISITVDRMGIVHDPVSTDGNISTLTFPELRARDQRQHLVILARINRDEALAAVDSVRDQQHRFMLI